MWTTVGAKLLTGSTRIPPPEKHAPSSLRQCHQKVSYRQENAPAEYERPEGIFCSDRRFEDDAMVSYLRDVVYDADE